MVKQVIVVRKDLKMVVGKIASQTSHASLKVLLDAMIKWKKYNISRKQRNKKRD